MMERKKVILLFAVIAFVILFSIYFWMTWERGCRKSSSVSEELRVSVEYWASVSSDGNCTLILPFLDTNDYTDAEIFGNFFFNGRSASQLPEKIGITNVIEAGYLKNSSGIDVEGYSALKLNINRYGNIFHGYIKCPSPTLTLKDRNEKGAYWMYIRPEGNRTNALHLTLIVSFQIEDKEGWYLVFFRNVAREEWGWVKLHPWRFIENKSPNYSLSYFHYALKVQSDGNYTIYAPVPVNTVWTDDVLLSKIYTGGGINSVEIINISEEENITINSSVENGSKALVVRGRGSGVLSFLYPSKVSPIPVISLPSLDPWKYWFYYEGDEESVVIKPVICREHYFMTTLEWYPQFEILKPGWNVVEIKEVPVLI